MLINEFTIRLSGFEWKIAIINPIKKAAKATIHIIKMGMLINRFINAKNKESTKNINKIIGVSFENW